MYFHENGKMLGTETVPYRQAATQPYRPQKPQTEEYYYIFKGSNNDLSHIEKDTMAKAVFEERQRSFVVRFFHENGTLLKEENVLYGQAAQEPEVPAKQQDEVYHYIFNGWDNTFDYIKENTEVHAVFSSVYNEYKVGIYEQLKRTPGRRKNLSLWRHNRLSCTKKKRVHFTVEYSSGNSDTKRKNLRKLGFFQSCRKSF